MFADLACPTGAIYPFDSYPLIQQRSVDTLADINDGPYAFVAGRIGGHGMDATDVVDV